MYSEYKVNAARLLEYTDVKAYTRQLEYQDKREWLLP
jgi:hypothetical protein